MEDTEIVKLFFDRDEEALSTVKTKYGRYILTITSNILKNNEDGCCICDPDHDDDEATSMIPDSEAATRFHHNNKWNNFWNLAYYTHYNTPTEPYLTYNIHISGHSL